MQELDVSNVCELQDFLINECMYAGIVRGKLDQLQRCFEQVQFAAGRDLRPEQLGSMIQTLSNWLTTSDNLLVSIQEKIKWADTMSQFDNKHRTDIEDKVEEVKKSISLKERLIELRESTLMTNEEIFAEVLPPKSTAFRGIGVLPKITKRQATQEVAALREEVESSTAKEKESEKRNQDLTAKFAAMERKMESILGILATTAGIELSSFDIGNFNPSNEGIIRNW